MMSLIGTLIVVIIVSVFAGFNLNNKCDINLVYKTFNDVPVFLAIMIAFVAGVIVSLPYVFVHRSAIKEKIKAKEEEKFRKEQEQNAEKKIEANSKNADVKADTKAGAEKKFSLFGKKKKDEEKPADEVTPALVEKPVDISTEATEKSEEIDDQSTRMQ